MLARVSDSYYGIFGLYNAETNSSISKTRKSAPFEIDDALFQRFEAQGILVKAGDEITTPVLRESAETDEPCTSEENGDDDIFSEMTYKELCAKAKEHSIKTVGVSREKIIEALKKIDNSAAEEEEMPVFEAEEPV